MPIVKIPNIDVKALKLSKLSLTGADLVLKVALANANHFGFNLNSLRYSFSVNGTDWVSSTASAVQSVAGHNESFLEFPFSLNFLKVGKSVYDMIAGNQPFGYSFAGAMDLTPSHKLIGPQSLSFGKTGRIAITK